ncbi:small redox-active disulfide protein 2 [Maridesulfovibrio ferrireducens]|uniref:Small redox-active disulfide protein 2 n=1 Tax=Maridesulfovibrio ferrireducens TaxID=246191 RepID=A0A1G9CWF4_9BACT|nr:thioredoxin family protein [Maridesulfovibrio ferrireducens]SDK55952.1 small redox-active disulfide protein 2 [Maridesulfovibrio ferrireducens]
MKIQVMGPGCPKCVKAEKIVKEAVLEAGLEIEVVKISDFQEIASFGVFSTPAVAIDGEVKIVGRVPSKNDVLSWITG